MLDRSLQSRHTLPFKSVAAALLFSAVLGPIGLLYSTYWGGFFMTLIGIVVISHKLFFPIALTWIICCVWAVGAVERYNKKILNMYSPNRSYS